MTDVDREPTLESTALDASEQMPLEQSAGIGGEAGQWHRSMSDVYRSVEAPTEFDRFGSVDTERRDLVPCAAQRPDRCYELTDADRPLSDADTDAITRAQDRVQAVLDAAEGRPLRVEDVRTAVAQINPTGSKENCVECSLAVNDLLEGRAAVAGPSTGQKLGAGSIRALEVRADDYSADDDPVRIAGELYQAGSGAHGIVVAYKSNDTGHAYNVANIDGQFYYIDGQAGTVSGFDPVNEPAELDYYRRSER